MNVLMISPSMTDPKNGGVGIVTQRLASLLSEKVSLTLIQPEDISLKEGELDPNTFDVSSIVKDITRKITGGIHVYEDQETLEEEVESGYLVKNQLQTFSEGVLEEVKSLDVDIIYAHDWVSFEAALVLKERIKKPLILHVHSMDVDRISSVNHSWVYDIEKKAFEQSDVIVTVSKYAAERLAQHYGIHPRKIKVVYSGVDQPNEVEFERRFKEPVVIFVGRLSGQKGAKQFLSIAEKVLSFRPKTRFVMAGDGEMKNDLIEMAAHKQIGDKVHFAGHLSRTELDKLFSEATVFCLPSISEPYGLSAVEAAAAEVPVIISRQSGASEVLTGAITIDHDNIDGFVSSISEVIDKKVAVEEIIDKNLKAIKSLTWKKTADQVLKIFNSFN